MVRERQLETGLLVVIQSSFFWTTKRKVHTHCEKYLKKRLCHETEINPPNHNIVRKALVEQGSSETGCARGQSAIS